MGAARLVLASCTQYKPPVFMGKLGMLCLFPTKKAQNYPPLGRHGALPGRLAFFTVFKFPPRRGQRSGQAR